MGIIRPTSIPASSWTAAQHRLWAEQLVTSSIEETACLAAEAYLAAAEIDAAALPSHLPLRDYVRACAADAARSRAIYETARVTSRTGA